MKTKPHPTNDATSHEPTVDPEEFRVDDKVYKWDSGWKAYLTPYLHDDAIGAKQMDCGRWAGYFCGNFDDFTSETYETPQQAAIAANSFFI